MATSWKSAVVSVNTKYDSWLAMGTAEMDVVSGEYQKLMPAPCFLTCPSLKQIV